MSAKFLYIVNVRFPTEKAHGLQIAKTCEALMEREALQALWVSNRKSSIKQTPEEYYALRKALPIKRVSTLNTVHWGFIGFLIQTMSFAGSAAIALRRDNTKAILYGRDEIVLWLLSFVSRGQPYIWETHTGSWNFFAKRIVRKAHAIVTISEGLKEFYLQKGVPGEKITVARDAIDPQDFTNVGTKADSRTRLNLPQDKKIAMYIGSLDMGKGADTFCKSAELLPDVLVVIIGGNSKQVQAYRKKYPQVIFCGQKPYRDIAKNQIAADLLVLPNTAEDIISSRFTSPLKLFAYMASKVPIVASDIPSIREVLADNSCYFVTPDNPERLAHTIRLALHDPESKNRANAAYERSLQCTWLNRADTIISLL